jgi:hypothetical protein
MVVSRKNVAIAIAEELCMFAPLIPVLTIFFLACVIMLVGLRLSPKRSASDGPQIEAFPRRNRSRQLPPASVPRSRRLIQKYDERIWAGPVPATRVVSVETVRSKPPFAWGGIPQHLRLPLVLILIFSGCLLLLIQTYARSGASLPISLVNAPAAQVASTPGVIATTKPKIETPSGTSQASKNVHHIAQMDRSQYNTDEEYNVWAPSACSAVAMTVVINAYKNNKYRVPDILKVEIEQHAIDPDLGLLEPSGINRTVDKFGFRTLQMNNAPLDSLIAVANNGWPIIVGFPPGVHWPGGHILVMMGGDAKNVFLADSAPSNLPSVTHDRFMQDWGGMALIVMPNDR